MIVKNCNFAKLLKKVYFNEGKIVEKGIIVTTVVNMVI